MRNFVLKMMNLSGSRQPGMVDGKKWRMEKVMNIPLKMMNFVFKNPEFCIKNDGFVNQGGKVNDGWKRT